MVQAVSGDRRSPRLRSACGCACAPLILDLQDGRVMVEDGQDDFVHVLPQTQVDLLLLLQGVHQLRTDREREIETSEELSNQTWLSHSSSRRPTSSLEALSISAARHWALV